MFLFWGEGAVRECAIEQYQIVFLLNSILNPEQIQESK